MANLLEMAEIDKSFYGVQVLKKVSLDLRPGEVHAFLGANGAGKSTSIKILPGAYSLDSGTVRIDGRDVDMAHHTPDQAMALGIVTIYQNFHLIPHLTVAENVCISDFATGPRRWVDWRSTREKARQALAAINLDVNPDALVKTLTVSQQQMLEIAIALSKNARIIIMDEPTAAISQRETENLFTIIRQVKQRGVGIIYISHRLEEIQQVADRVTVLRDGMNVGTMEVGEELDIGRVVELIAGREVKSGRRARSVTPGGEFASIENISVAGFDNDISFTIRKGEILGLTGLVGAGKTEFTRALFGADKPLAGRVVVEGKPVDVSTPDTAIAGGLGYLPEDRDTSGLCLDLSLKDNITMTLLAKSRSGVFSVNHERGLSGRYRRDLSIKSVNLDQQVRYLSGGNKQKVIFAKWLTAKCKFLILDEPTIGIDVGARDDIYRLIDDFTAAGGAVLLVTSDFEEALTVCDRIMVMSRGNLVCELDPDQTNKPEMMAYCLDVHGKTSSVRTR